MLKIHYGTYLNGAPLDAQIRETAAKFHASTGLIADTAMLHIDDADQAEDVAVESIEIMTTALSGYRALVCVGVAG